MTSAHTTYDSGQCTRWVADRFAGQIGPYWGDASHWLAAAASAGFVIGNAPELGAIAVWSPYQGGASPAGHVALVVALDPLTVSESNWHEDLRPGTRVLPVPPGVAGYVLAPKESAMTLDLARGIVLLQFFRVRDGLTAPQADVDYWAARMLAEGCETILNLMNETPEFSADRAREAAAAAKETPTS